MQSRLVWVYASSLALLIGAGPLPRTGPLPPISPEQLGLPWLSGGSYKGYDGAGAGEPVPLCSDILSPASLGKRMGYVRVVVSRAMFKRTHRDVKTIDTSGDFDKEKKSVIDQPSYLGIKSTRLDFETSKAKDAGSYNDNDYILVKLVLRKELRFISGHEVSVPSGQNSICDLTAVRTYTKPNSVGDKLYFIEFKVLLKNGSKDYSNYNVGVALIDEDDDSTVELPIFIDPKIKHDGY